MILNARCPNYSKLSKDKTVLFLTIQGSKTLNWETATKGSGCPIPNQALTQEALTPLPNNKRNQSVWDMGALEDNGASGALYQQALSLICIILILYFISGTHRVWYKININVNSHNLPLKVPYPLISGVDVWKQLCLLCFFHLAEVSCSCLTPLDNDFVSIIIIIINTKQQQQ